MLSLSYIFYFDQHLQFTLVRARVCVCVCVRLPVCADLIMAPDYE